MHQQNPVDAPPESRGTTRIRRTPTESCFHLQREVVRRAICLANTEISLYIDIQNWTTRLSTQIVGRTNWIGFD